jgi:hypothetical protein
LAAFTAEKQAKKISEIKEAEAHASQKLEAIAPLPVVDISLGGDVILPDIEVESPTQPPIANLTGWVSHLGQWVAAKVIGWCEKGTRYRILYEIKCGEWSEMLVFPNEMRWGHTL